MPSKDQRLSYYRKVFGNNPFPLKFFERGGVPYMQGQNKEGKAVGRRIKLGAEAHRRLVKLYPNKFPPVEGFVPVGDRLVRKEKANITNRLKAADYKQLGFKTAKQGREFVKALKPAGNFFFDMDAFKRVVANLGRYNAKEVGERVSALASRMGRAARRHLQKVESVELTDTAYKNFTKALQFRTKGNMATRPNGMYSYFNRVFPALRVALLKFLGEQPAGTGVRFFMVVKAVMELDAKDGVKREDISFRSNGLKSLLTKQAIKNDADVETWLKAATHEIIDNIEKFVKGGSGWRLIELNETYLNMSEFKPRKAGKYFELPKWLSSKKCLYIPKNDDDFCAWYSCVYALEHKNIPDHPERISALKKFERKYPIDPSLFPLEVCYNSYRHAKLEEMFNAKINLWTVEAKEKFNSGKIEFSSKKSYPNQIDLLMILDNKNNRRHFAYIKDVAAYLRGNGSSSGKTHLCRNCSRVFQYEYLLNAHKELCDKHETCKITMPAEGKTTRFTKHCTKLPCPYVIIWDCETWFKKIDGEGEDKRTTKLFEHVPSGAYAVVYSWFEGKIIKEFHYNKDKCVDRMVRDVHEYACKLFDQMYNHPKEIQMSNEDEEDFAKATHCYICEEPWGTDEERKVYNGKLREIKREAGYDEAMIRALKSQRKLVEPRKPCADHCHFTGKYRGAACSPCNRLLKKKLEIPCFAHNFKGYDSHFLLRGLDKKMEECNTIPLNSGKIIELSTNLDADDSGGKPWEKPRLVFRDSMCHLNSSLEKLAKLLKRDDELVEDEFSCTREFIRSLSSNEEDFKVKFDLASKKGAFPYEYFTSLKRYEETAMPDAKYFVSVLEHHGKTLNQLETKDRLKVKEAHQRAVRAFEVFGCKTLWDYHDFYMKLDVYLTADVMTKYRKTGLENFGIDPVYYPTLPSYCWQAMLKTTGEELELLHDHDMYMMLEEGKIGGISMVGSKRYAKANHKMLASFDPSLANKHIIYGDVNGLYSWAMKQKLPYSDFKWIDAGSFKLEEALRDVDGDVGYFLKVDFPIPKELHDKFKDYPILPENLVVSEDMLSPHQQKIKERLLQLKYFNETDVSKLVPNLYNKENYVIHIKHLKLALELCEGLVKPEDVKIHSGIRFIQKAWLKPYIDLCMTNRQKSKNSFDKDFWKLCSNAVFGKTMENVRDRMDMKIYTDPEAARDKFNDFRLTHYEIKDGIAALYRTKRSVTLDKPIYAGVAILNLSKCLMYDLFYNKLKAQYGEKLALLYTDTDSFIFEVECEDFYKDIDPSLWDTSEYPKDHPLYSLENKKVEGKLKDEAKGIPIEAVAANRAKQYAYRKDYSKFQTEDEEWLKENPVEADKCVGKGIAKSILKRGSMTNYEKAIFHNFEESNMCQTVAVVNFVAEKHRVSTARTLKKYVSSYDNKRSLMDDGVNQLPFGHYKLEEMRRGERPWVV